MSENIKKHILFLCTGNSCRSQMAEGLLRQAAAERYEAHSAGVHPSEVNPLAILVMAEIGINISTYRSKHIDEYLKPGVQALDLIITVCDKAKQTCPVFPKPVPMEHILFEDPADATGSEEERLVVFRKVRDQIKAMIEIKFVKGDV